MIDDIIRSVVREEVQRLLKECGVARHKDALLTRDQVINDYAEMGVKSYYHINQLERKRGLRRAKDGRPILYRRSEIERVLNEDHTHSPSH